jgi:hypothetical protein
MTFAKEIPLQPGTLGPAMHNYRSQNVYITSTASERILDTLEFVPHNSPMPQISSTDRLLMAAHDMNDALKHPHPDVPFSTIGDETITALTTLEAILKNKFKKPLAPVIIESPIKAAEKNTQRYSSNQSSHPQPSIIITPGHKKK